MKLVPRFLLPVALLCLSAAPTLAQWSVSPVSQVRSGFISYTDHTSKDLSLTGPLGENSGAAIDLAPDAGHTLDEGHLEVSFTFAVRYTARQPNETIPDSYSGMIGYVMAVAATSSSTPSIVTSASVHPDGDAAVSVAVSAYDYGPGFIYPFSDRKAQSKYIPRTVALSTNGQVGAVRFKEGYTTVKVVLDIVGNGGTAEAHCDMWLGRPKGISVIRPENSGPVTWDDGDSLGGFLELDGYNSDGSVGSGNSRFSNVEYLVGAAGVTSFGTDFGDEGWSPSLFGMLWPDSDAFNSQYFTRHWHWFGTAVNSQTHQDTGTGYAVSEDWTFDIGGYTTGRPHVDWPYDSNGNWLPKSKTDTGYPAPVANRIDLHLTDTDTHTDPDTTPHPERTYDQHAAFNITFHNEFEEQTIYKSGYVPTSENPWHKGHYQNDTDAFATGPITGWSPTLELYNPDQISYTFNLLSPGAEIAATWTPHDDLFTAVPPFDIGPGIQCMCYWRPALNRNWYHYKHYLQGGRHIIGFDETGQEKPHEGTDTYSSSGSDPPSLLFAFMTHDPNVVNHDWTGFPDTYGFDITGASN